MVELYDESIEELEYKIERLSEENEKLKEDFDSLFDAYYYTTTDV